jgi:hypothetical protein
VRRTSAASRTAGDAAARAHVAGEGDRRGGGAADHRRVGARERECLEPWIELAGEDDVRATVIPRDHHEQQPALEADDRTGDLRAVLELELPQRLG